jgi:hypothetical protein
MRLRLSRTQALEASDVRGAALAVLHISFLASVCPLLGRRLARQGLRLPPWRLPAEARHQAACTRSSGSTALESPANVRPGFGRTCGRTLLAAKSLLLEARKAKNASRDRAGTAGSSRPPEPGSAGIMLPAKSAKPPSTRRPRANDGSLASLRRYPQSDKRTFRNGHQQLGCCARPRGSVSLPHYAGGPTRETSRAGPFRTCIQPPRDRDRGWFAWESSVRREIRGRQRPAERFDPRERGTPNGKAAGLCRRWSQTRTCVRRRRFGLVDSPLCGNNRVERRVLACTGAVWTGGCRRLPDIVSVRESA